MRSDLTSEEKIEKLEFAIEFFEQRLAEAEEREQLGEIGAWQNETQTRYCNMLQLEIMDLRQKRRWEKQSHQCSGPGYSHAPHGKCSGYSTDRT